MPGSGRVVEEGASRSGFRADIEGLRAIAVVLVLLGHAGVAPMAGGFIGVDVFFVISGFVITTVLIRELVATGTISVARFYARRAKRLLPAAALVLVVTALMSWWLLPPIRLAGIARDVVFTALYVQNWRLAAGSTDYLAQDEAPSPLQHFWSLSVEEQFYFVWPLLLLLLPVLARRLGGGHGVWRGAVPWLFAGMAMVAIPSLWWSIAYTASNPAEAYFVTTTRMWELAAGGGVAIAAAWFARTPRTVAVPLAWAGLGLAVTSALLIDGSTPYPGSAALAPVLATAGVIAFGPAAGRWGPSVLLGRKPMRWIGKLSYSWYLWHWPLVVVATARLGELSTAEGLLVVAVSLLPAYLSFRLVEDPIRRSVVLARVPSRGLALGLGCAILAVGTGLVLTQVTRPATPIAEARELQHQGGGGDRLGAMALPSAARGAAAGTPTDSADRIVPDPLVARDDFTDCQATPVDDDAVSSCTWGPRNAQTRVLVLGDSHVQQWIPAITVLADQRGWRVTAHIKSSCPFTAAVPAASDGSRNVSCVRWNTTMRERLRHTRPDLVITSHLTRGTMLPDGRILPPDDPGPDGMAAGLRTAWSLFTDRGIPVLEIRDTPFSEIDVPECVSQHRDDLTMCAGRRAVWMKGRGVDSALAARHHDGVEIVDLDDAICPAAMCSPVIGDVLVYRDSNHLTATYAWSLHPRLLRYVDRALGANRTS